MTKHRIYPILSLEKPISPIELEILPFDEEKLLRNFSLVWESNVEEGESPLQAARRLLNFELIGSQVLIQYKHLPFGEVWYGYDNSRIWLHYKGKKVEMYVKNS